MKLRKTSLVALEIITPLLLLALWWVLSANSESAYNPPLSEIMARFGENWFGERLFSDLLPSLGRMFGGFFLAVIIGTGIGSIVGLSKIARRLTSPIVSFLRSIPGAALLPPAVLLLGIGNEMKIAVIAFICIWPIMLNTIDGIDETHATMTNTARVLQIRGYRRFFWIILPAASPRIFAGMRTSLALSMIMLVISEMIASTGGLGNFIIQAQRLFQIDQMWSGIIVLGLLGYLFTLAFAGVEKVVLKWYLESKA